MPLPYHMMSPLQQQYAMRSARSSQEHQDTVPYISTNRPSKQTALRDTSWQKGDEAPFALDNSPRGARPMPASIIARDPGFYGYKSKGSAGYGAEMLFGFTPPERPAVNAQVAEWRATRVTNDSNPFTLDGSVPAPSPRRDPGRKLQKELMAQIDSNDTIAIEAARGDMQRYERFVERNGGIDPNVMPGTEVGFYPPSMAPKDTSRRDELMKSGTDTSWRAGDSHPLTLDGSIVPPRVKNRTNDSTWRKFDTHGIAQFDLSNSSSTVHEEGYQNRSPYSSRSNYGSSPDASPSFNGQYRKQQQQMAAAQFDRHHTPAMSRLLPDIIDDQDRGSRPPNFYGPK